MPSASGVVPAGARAGVWAAVAPGCMVTPLRRPVPEPRGCRFRGPPFVLSGALTTDGPFVELKEALGGYLFVEADDLDAAIELASRIPAARMGGAIAVRPLVER